LGGKFDKDVENEKEKKKKKGRECETLILEINTEY
jgi:hypothetical protein